MSELVNTIAQSASGSSITTGNIDTTGCKSLFVFVNNYVSAAAAVLSDSKGNTWTALTTRTSATLRVTLYYCINAPTVGSGHNFTATQTGSGFPSITVAGFDDVVHAFDVQATNSNTGTTISAGSVTPGTDGAIVIACLASLSNTLGFSIDSGYTITDQGPWGSSQHFGTVLAYNIQGSATTENPVFTVNGSYENLTEIAVFRTTALSKATMAAMILYAEVGDAPTPTISPEDTRSTLAACVRSKNTAAWGKWKFSGTLRAYAVIDNMLVISIERGDTVFVETIDISPVLGTRFLDCEILSADMSAPVLDTGVTTWTLPFSLPDDSEHPLTVVNTDTGEAIPTLTRTAATEISATGDFTDTSVAIGLLYPTQWELTPLFVTTQEADNETIALTDGHLQIRHVEFNFDKTGEFSVTVIPNTDDESQSYTYTYDGATDAQKGVYRVPVFGHNTKAKITVGGASHRPFAIPNFSWTGYLSQITKRV